MAWRVRSCNLQNAHVSVALPASLSVSIDLEDPCTEVKFKNKLWVLHFHNGVATGTKRSDMHQLLVNCKPIETSAAADNIASL